MGPYAWITWYVPVIIVYAVSILITINYINTYKIKIVLTPKLVYLILIYYITWLLMNRESLIISSFFFVGHNLSLLVLLVTRDKNALTFIQKGLFFIFVPSIFLFLLFTLFDYPSTSFVIQYKTMGEYKFYNYFFLIKLIDDFDFRFNSIFLEPGYLGLLCVFILYVDNFNLKKKENVAILIALLISLSLAAYILIILAFIIRQWVLGRSLKGFLIVSIVLSGMVMFFLNYNDGQNIVNGKILYRLTIDEGTGTIIGNNRFTSVTDDIFDKLRSNGEIFLGKGNEFVDNYNKKRDYESGISGAGYKIFFIRYGYITAFFTLLLYYLIGCYYKKKKRLALGFIILATVAFMQCAYPTSYSWLIPLILRLIPLIFAAI